jgi:MoaA/NifB/PqqE/SkfB family radical SAM enzyme
MAMTAAASTIGVARNFLSRQLGWPAPRPIGYLVLAFTYLCNARCIMCNVWRRYRAEPGEAAEEAPAASWLAWLRASELVRAAPSLDITGGEPFLRADLGELLHGLLELESVRRLAINTNGLITDRIIEVMSAILPAARPSQEVSVAVSLDGLGGVHDRIRGVPGAFARADQTLRGLVSLRHRWPQLKVSLTVVLQPDNLDQLSELQQYADSGGLPLGCTIVQQSYVLDNRNGGPRARDFTPGQRETLTRLAKERQFVGLRRYLDRPERRPLPCYAGHTAVYLDPFADVYPCVTIANHPDFVMGRLPDLPLDEVWRSPQAARVRLRCRHCTHADCWSGCELRQTLVQHEPLRRLVGRLSRGRLDYYRLRRLL